MMSFLLLAAVLSAPVEPADARVSLRTSIEFCFFTPPEIYRKMTASLEARYQFEIAADGQVLNVRELSPGSLGSQFAPADQVNACLSRWSLEGLPSGGPYIVTFTWTAGFGWTSIRIEGKGVALAFGVSGDRCPYLASVPGSKKLPRRAEKKW